MATTGVEIKGIEQLRARFEAIKPNPSMMRALALHAIREQKLLAPRKTGNLGRSIVLGRVDAVSAETKATAKYAAAIEGGSGLYGPKKKKYPIYPKKKKALFFASQHALTANVEAAYGKGRAKRAKFRTRLSGSPTSGTLKRYGNLAFVHAKSVMHPGVKAQPFMVPGAQKAIELAGAGEIIKAWNEAA